MTGCPHRLDLVIEGINPEPWRSPNLGRGRGGRPIAYKDENLRSYQEALAETIAGALAEQQLDTPVFPKGFPLAVRMAFWRQLDSYEAGTGRRHTRHSADVTNLVKAAEDALQGLVYANDRSNRTLHAELIADGPDVEPGLWITITPTVRLTVDTLAEVRERVPELVSDSTRTVWLRAT